MRKLFTIDGIKETAVPIAKRYGLAKLALFGSYANDTATPHSDIDFLIDKGDLFGLWEYAGLVMDLEEQLGVHVDVLTYDQLKKSLMEDAAKGEVTLYER